MNKNLHGDYIQKTARETNSQGLSANFKSAERPNQGAKIKD